MRACWFVPPQSYTEKAPNAGHRQGTPKTGNTCNQFKRPSTGTTHRQRTRHYRKGSPGVKTHNTNQHSGRERFQHSNPPPSLPTPNWVTTRSSQPTELAAKHRRAEPHYNTDTTRLSGDTHRPPPGGAHYQEWLGGPIVRSGLGGPLSGVADGQPRAHGHPLGRVRGKGGGGALAEDMWVAEGGKGSCSASDCCRDLSWEA